MKRELVFTAYNRPYYLQTVIPSWNRVRNLAQWPASFFIEPSNQLAPVVQLAMELNTTVTTVVNETVQGVLVNPWNALDHAFGGGADFVVLAEDDVVVSQDILEYFEWTSIEYQTSYRTLCINAFSGIGEGKDNEVYTDNIFSPLIWGTWRDRWYNTLRDSWDKNYSTGNADGSEAGWDWNINRILKRDNLQVIHPSNSRSDHIGEHGGTHMTPELFYTSRGASFQESRGRQRYREI